MAEAGRQHVVRLFTWPAVADRVEAVYHQVLETKSHKHQVGTP